MHSMETQQPTRMRTLSAPLTETEHAEFGRLSRTRYERTPGKQAARVIRDWIAAEQAAEAAEAAEGRAA